MYLIEAINRDGDTLHLTVEMTVNKKSLKCNVPVKNPSTIEDIIAEVEKREAAELAESINAPKLTALMAELVAKHPEKCKAELKGKS